MRFEGIYTPIVTPFHEDHAIHHDALAAAVEHLVAAGVHGIIVAGTTGEYYAHTPSPTLIMPQVRSGAAECSG